MNEVYCNDTAMNLAFTIESVKPFPDTMINENNGIPLIYFDAGTEMPLSYNPDFKPNDPYLDGQMIDDHTYAGVLRIALEGVYLLLVPDDLKNSKKQGENHNLRADYHPAHSPLQTHQLP